MADRLEPARSLDHCDLRCPVGPFGAHIVLLVVIGFLIAVVLGFGKADRAPAHRSQIMIAVGEPSPIPLQHEAPIAQPSPVANVGCRP